MGWVNRILVPVDLSACSLAALRYAAFLAQHDGSQLYVVHVLDPNEAAGDAGDQLQRERQTRRLRDLVAATETIGAQVARVAVVKGDPASVIVESAQTEQVDVIVMGKYGDGGRRLTQPGNVASRVALLASCGVISVHEPSLRGSDYALTASETAAAVTSDVAEDLSNRVVSIRSGRRRNRRPGEDRDGRSPRPHH